ncbi:hypothetical protein CHH83_01355 [Bacillus sp. 7586-K]|nr:hypothetical protein CHH83_01355 [Bacillus sp. 7586-K]
MEKTRITLVTGEEIDVNIEKEKFIEEISNDFGGVYNEIIQVSDTVSVATLHIVKIERIHN